MTSFLHSSASIAPAPHPRQAQRSLEAMMIDSLVGNDYAVCLCRALADAGVRVGLVVPQNRSIDAPVSFPVLRWSPSKEPGRARLSKMTGYLRYAAKLLHYVRQNRGALIHYQFFRRERIESILFCLMRLLGARMIYTAHNVFPHDRRRIDYFLKKCIYRSSHRIIAHSRFIRDELVAQFNVDPAAIEIIAHGNFDAHLPDRPISREQSRSALCLGEEDHVLLFFGVLRPNKGLSMLLSAFKTAAGSDPHLKLLIAGAPPSGALDNAYRSQIAATGCGDRIAYHGDYVAHQEVPLYFTACDIVILPYRIIYHSGVLHAAFSFGRPVIATDVGDFRETVENGTTGFVLQRNTADNLAAMIGRAFADPDKLAEMGRTAREFSRTRFSWEEIAIKTKQLYCEARSEATGL